MLVLAGVVLTLAACGPVSPAALTVDGDEVVSRADLFDDLSERADATGTGPVEGTLPQEWASERLSFLAQTAILEQYVDDHGLEVTAEHRASGEASVVGADAQFPYSLDVLDDLQATAFALQAAIDEGLLDDELDALAELSCVRHVLLETEVDAESVLAELADGADFAELAAERSIDPSAATNGGDLGCAPRRAYVQTFDDAVWAASPGDVLGPISSEFGFHIIEVLDRQTGSAADVPAEQRLSLIATSAFDGADVHVDPRFGGWGGPTANYGVVPPEGAFVPPLTGDDGVLTIPVEPAS